MTESTRTGPQSTRSRRSAIDEPTGATPRRSTPSHKERLLRQGAREFYETGFHGAAVDAILKHANVPKGSFYHHFGSKDQFALRVLDRYHAFQMGQLAHWSQRTDLPVPARVRGYYLAMVDGFVDSGFKRACLAGKFSSEVAASSELIRLQLAASLTEWRGGIEALLETGQRDGGVRTDRSARDLAESLLALMQGAFVVGLSVRSEQALRSIADSIDALLKPE